MLRFIEKELDCWKNSNVRKVLLVRGARQIGKTYSIRLFGRKFEHFLEVNFEKHPEIKTFFKGSKSPDDICPKLQNFFNIPIVPGKTLLFFDEIQACPECLQSLRFFYEDMNELHVVAAGSLLEFALSEIPSFGVGRISSLFMYPMSFFEFLFATDAERYVEMIRSCNSSNPMDTVFHATLLERLRSYLAVGGMPAVVESFRQKQDIRECHTILSDLLETLLDDLAKYKKKASVDRLKEALKSVAEQMGRKFIYSKVTPVGSLYETKKALELLVDAGLIYKVCHSSARGIPLGAQVNTERFKALIFDIGLFQRIIGIDVSAHIITHMDQLVNKGSLAELFVGLELISGSSPRLRHDLFYWHREAKSSNAEVDYLIQRGAKIIPIEVKSRTRGGMKSLHLFLKERNLKTGIRLSHENFSHVEPIVCIPLYAASNLINNEININLG